MSLTDTVSYVVDGLRESYDDPFWWRERVFEFLVGPFHTNVYPGRTGSVRVMGEDWDTLAFVHGCCEYLITVRAPRAN